MPEPLVSCHCHNKTPNQSIWNVCTGCPKKTGISVKGSFEALKWPKIQKKIENRPLLKFNFTHEEGFQVNLWIVNMSYESV